MEYTVSEGNGEVTVFLGKMGENEIPVTVSVVTETRDGTAQGQSTRYSSSASNFIYFYLPIAPV